MNNRWIVSIDLKDMTLFVMSDLDNYYDASEYKEDAKIFHSYSDAKEASSIMQERYYQLKPWNIIEC
jgi:hypothetical protein